MHSGVGTGAKDEIDCKDGRDSKEREEEWLHGRPRKGARKILERRGRAGKFRNRATRAPHVRHTCATPGPQHAVEDAETKVCSFSIEHCDTIWRLDGASTS